MLDFSNLSLICRKTQNEEIPERTLREMGFPIDVPDVQSPSFDLVFFQLHDKLFESSYVKYGSVGHIYLTFLMQNRDAAVAFRQTQQTLEPFHVTSEELQHELNLYGIDSLTAEDTELLCEVFQYLIETLLPRQLGDLYVDFSLRSHPA